MNRTITTEETEKLFEFCREHFVYHYDLQVELVDHLASSIEEQWEKQPELTFEEALNITFKKFGIHGFSKIKEQKQKELGRKYSILLWKYLLQFYTWPKMLMTLAGTMVMFTLFRLINNRLWIFIPLLFVLAIALLYYYFILFPKRFKIKPRQGKSFLILELLKNVQFLTIIAAQLPIHIWNMTKFQFGNNPIIVFLVSLFFVTFTIALYGNFFYIPQKIKEHFKEQFPEFATG